jgi:hypothetical protein
MDRSKIQAAAGDRIAFVSQLAELDQAVDATTELVIVDLGRPGASGAISAVTGRARIIGYGSHVDRITLDAARAAGCDEVLPRSQFFARVGDLLAQP